jgi:hypothetical protein
VYLLSSPPKLAGTVAGSIWTGKKDDLLLNFIAKPYHWGDIHPVPKSIPQQTNSVLFFYLCDLHTLWYLLLFPVKCKRFGEVLRKLSKRKLFLHLKVKLNVAKESARRKKGCNSLETTEIKE